MKTRYEFTLHPILNAKSNAYNYLMLDADGEPWALIHCDAFDIKIQPNQDHRIELNFPDIADRNGP